MRILLALVAAAALSTGAPLAKLPPPSDDARAKADEAKSKAAWADKVAAYKTCLAVDRIAERYRQEQAAAGKQIPPAIGTPPCTDPGPGPSSRPLEASEAHSPPDAAHKPPSTPTTQAQQ